MTTANAQTQPQQTPTTTAIAVQEKGDPRLTQVRQLLEKSHANLKVALPKHISAEYMIRVALTSVQRTPALLDCHPITLIGAVFQAAQLGLVPDGVLGQAYLVPFWNNAKKRREVQFIPGYKGLITLARRSGEVSTISADVVYEKDTFKYSKGLNPILEHQPTEEPNPGAMKFAYAFARLKDGGYQIEVMNRRQVEAIKGRSQGVKAAKEKGFSTPWDTDEAWMWKKTALRQLSKLLPASVELQRAIALDERAEIGLPQDLSLLADDTETPTPDDVIDGATGSQVDPLEEEMGALDAELQKNLRIVFNDLNMTQGQALADLRRAKGNEAQLLADLRAKAYEKLRNGNGGNGHGKTAAPATTETNGEAATPVTNGGGPKPVSQSRFSI